MVRMCVFLIIWGRLPIVVFCTRKPFGECFLSKPRERNDRESHFYWHCWKWKVSRLPRRAKRCSARSCLLLDSNMRETDVTGWYKEDCIVGLMFTEIAAEERGSILATIMARVNQTLRSHLTAQQYGQVSISFHLFPEEREERIIRAKSAPPLYTDRPVIDEARRVGSR